MGDTSYEFSDNALCRRYFAKLDQIFGHLRNIAHNGAPASEAAELGKIEAEMIEAYLVRLTNSFAALSLKHLLTGLVRHALPHKLEIDQSDSGFPLFREFIAMTDDRARAQDRLQELPERSALKSQLIDRVLQQRTIPRELQFKLSQRSYHETLCERPLFLAQNEPGFVPLEPSDPDLDRYLVHWAVYDTQRNFPNIYLLILDSPAKRPLHSDQALQKEIATHLLAQSLSTLKLVTIANGFDKDFPDLHPKLIKRLHIGPLYSNRFTRHTDRVQQLLAEAQEVPGQDWVMSWTVETLISKKTRRVASGLFGDTLQQVYHLDIHNPEVFEAGASAIERSVIMPSRVYQSLLSQDREVLMGAQTFVVGPDGLLLAHA